MPFSMTLRPILWSLLRASLAWQPAPVLAQSASGAYLAARQARLDNNFASAQIYLNRLLSFAADDLGVIDAAVVAGMSTGDFEAIADNARQLLAEDPASRSAALALLSLAFQTEDYAAATELSSGEVVIHPLVEGLAKAWANMGRGQMSDALADFAVVEADETLRPFALYCRALALAMVGDVEGALVILEQQEGDGAIALNRRGYIAYAQLLALTERYDDALVVLGDVFNGSNDPQIAAMVAAYSEGRALPFDLVRTPAQGMAEVFAVMASATRSAENLLDALIYAQAAVAVNPRLFDAQLLVGQIFEHLGQGEAAVAAYARIPDDDGFAIAARLGQASVMESLGQMDAAIDVLRAAVDANPQSLAGPQLLGDFLRRAGRHDEALAAYERATAQFEAAGVEPGWQLYFARAVAFERTGQWESAYADFRRALEDDPDQPSVLNYLGYTLVERGENLDEALSMIQRAVAAQPDSGYIVDSLAWALYRMGRYVQAVSHMERAVELEPTDAILNDHLGDVYWAVGRHREARFQWRRALSFAPADDLDEDRVRRKIEDGLDAVLEDEGRPRWRARVPPRNDVSCSDGFGQDQPDAACHRAAR
ncbi:MAG: tetratricopeptide repeat protein [Paracoccaceae bacterium]